MYENPSITSVSPKDSRVHADKCVDDVGSVRGSGLPCSLQQLLSNLVNVRGPSGKKLVLAFILSVRRLGHTKQIQKRTLSRTHGSVRAAQVKQLLSQGCI